MRSIVLCCLILSMSVMTVSAQDIRLGVHTGVDAATFRISGAQGGIIKRKTELTAGVSVEAKFSSLLAVQLEGNFSQQGTALIANDGSSVISYGLDYITVPLMAKLYATPQLSFLAGPQVGFLMKATVKSLNAENQDAKDLLESTDVYSVLGTEYRFASGVTVGARYHIGMMGISKDGAGGDLKNNYYSLRIGYSFSLK